MGQGAAEPGVVYLVGAGPGDPELITLRGLSLLRTADAILHDELVHPALLRHARDGADVVHVGKRGGTPGAKQLKQSEIDARLVELARAGKSVVRLKGGDPYLFGRGSEEAEALVAAGVRFEVVPGVCSPLGAAAYAGISLTHRELASSVVMVSGVTRSGQLFDFRELAGTRGTVCVLMAFHRLREICAALVRDAERPGTTPACVIQSGTRGEQRVIEGTLDDLADRVASAQLHTPALMIAGDVVRLREQLRFFDAQPLFGKRVLVTRADHQAEATASLLRRRGAEPIEVPLISMQPPPDPDRVVRAVSELGSYDVVAFTSENGVVKFFDAVAAAGRDARAFGHCLVAAIGEGTARALLARGVIADVVPGSFRGEALAEAILGEADPSAAQAVRPRVLIPRALVAREVLPDTLRAGGCEVDVVPVYETRAAGAERRAELLSMLEDRQIDIVLLASSSTVDSLCDLLGPRAVELMAGVIVASIGEITTTTAGRRGLRVDVTAEKSTLRGLVDAVEVFCSAASRTIV